MSPFLQQDGDQEQTRTEHHATIAADFADRHKLHFTSFTVASIKFWNYLVENPIKPSPC